MTEIKISEQRFFELQKHELECQELFKSIIVSYARDYIGDRDEYQKREIDLKIFEGILNKRLSDNRIFFNGRPGNVWFASGRILLFWAYHDSMAIDGIL